MPEQAAGLDPRLWRAVIYPLFEAGVDRVLVDSPGEFVAERTLAVTSASVRAVAPAPGLDPLVALYGGRLSVHGSVADAWNAHDGCDLAVVDVARALPEHVESARRTAESSGRRPALLVHGPDAVDALASTELRSSAAIFEEHGWLVLDIPGFSGAQLAFLQPGDRLARRASSIVTRLGSRSADPRLHELARALAEARAERESAQRREQLARELARVLRVSLDTADLVAQRVQRALEAQRARADQLEWQLAELGPLRAERDRLEREGEHTRQQRDRQQSELVVLRADRDRLARELAGLEARVDALDEVRLVTAAELDRVARSSAWRIGHRLTRIARVLTFRKPGRTDGVMRAVERLERGEQGR